MIKISSESGIINFAMTGCHGHNHQTSGCENALIISERFHPSRATPITRMFLHTMFGRTSEIDSIITKFDEYFGGGKNADKNGLEYLKTLILENCAKDKTWKMCPTCKIEYDAKTRTFENIIFIVPSANNCIEHSQGS